MTTPPVTETIAEAIEEIRATFADSAVTVVGDGNGGVWVRIDAVALGSVYEQDSTWLAFQITYPYPEADVYPHFVRPDLRRNDGAPNGTGFQAVTWGPDEQAGTQLSRRSNRLDPAIDTAATKALKVLAWLNEQ
ncbi:hypothetical protein QWI29_03985 [Mycolicibacterium neoaurum]|uniref:hypothetical protein n=1 Tax=Mycolicibacterium neoaurum TaxID=1795 RepID=UPI0026721F5C|nr:hypothetical protein [Mycolicibacterium neoaurum]MDO3399178.1 hypothetical protein [Mycolicibacterium neoaurum]